MILIGILIALVVVIVLQVRLLRRGNFVNVVHQHYYTPSGDKNYPNKRDNVPDQRDNNRYQRKY